jgi:hypothetical protein
MSCPFPSHDIWITVLQNVEYGLQLETCNLVCRAWHALLRPRLMLAICIGEHNHPNPDDAHVFRRCGHLVQELIVRYENYNPYRWRETLDLIAASFTRLVTLKLSHVEFSSVEDLQSCLSAMPISLERLFILDCTCRDALEVRELLGDEVLATQRHSHALRTIQLDSEHQGFFACFLWSWFDENSTLSVLRALDVRFHTVVEADLRRLFAFLNGSEHSVEVFKLTVGEWIDEDEIAGTWTFFLVIAYCA